MEIMNRIPERLSRKATGIAMTLRKNSPHIFFGAGIAGVLGGTVLACRATLKLPAQVDAMRGAIDDLNHEADGEPADYAAVYFTHIANIVKTYAPAVGVTGIGIALLTKSHLQLTQRNAALTAAYAALQKALSEYRARVREEVGEEREEQLYRAIQTVKAESGDKVAFHFIGIDEIVF